MKKILLGIIMCIFVSSLVLAQGTGQGVHEPGTGIEDPELKETSQGSGQGLSDDSEEGEEAEPTMLATDNEVQNKGAASNIETKEQAQVNNPDTGEQVKEQVQEKIMTAEGKEVQVENKGAASELKAGNALAKTSMVMTQEQTEEGTKLQVKLSNGQNAEIKVMPDSASEKALERLQLKVCSEENNCNIELKEVGTGEETRAAYEVQAQKQAKVLGLFKTQMQVEAQVDAETGEVIQSKKPWWAFLASESVE